MKQQHIGLLGFGILVTAIFVVEFFLGDKISTEARSAWHDFAVDNGLTYKPGEKPLDFGRIEGTLRGRQFAMWTYETPDDSRDTGVVTRGRMTLRPIGMPGGFVIYPRQHGLIGQTMENWAFGKTTEMGAKFAPTVTIGDASFDKEWVIRGFDPDAVRAWLASRQRSEAILAFVAEANLDSWEDNIRWEGSSPTTQQEVEEIVGLLEYHAKRIEDAESR